jgi:hypothetical protein
VRIGAAPILVDTEGLEDGVRRIGIKGGLELSEQFAGYRRNVFDAWAPSSSSPLLVLTLRDCPHQSVPCVVSGRKRNRQGAPRFPGFPSRKVTFLNESRWIYADFEEMTLRIDL